MLVPFTTAAKAEETDLALKVAGGSQQAVDAVRGAVGEGECQQLLPGLQLPVSVALTQQAAHIPGQTVAWRKGRKRRGRGHMRSKVLTKARQSRQTFCYSSGDICHSVFWRYLEAHSTESLQISHARAMSVCAGGPKWLPWDNIGLFGALFGAAATGVGGDRRQNPPSMTMGAFSVLGGYFRFEGRETSHT